MKLSPLAIGTAAVVGLIGFGLYRKAKAAVPAGAALPDDGNPAPALTAPKPNGRQFLELAMPVLLLAGGVYAYKRLA